MTAVTTTSSTRGESRRPSRGAAAARAVSRHPRGGDDPAVRQQRLLGADRHTGGDLLGAGLRPQPYRRLRRASGDRLCRAADARRLHHERAGCRQCHAAGAGVRRTADRGLRRRRVRCDRRLAGACGCARSISRCRRSASPPSSRRSRWPGRASPAAASALSGPEFPAPFNTAWGFYYLCIAFAAFCTWMSANIAHSRFGRALIAVRDAEVAAEATGISKPRMLIAIFLFAGALAAIAGGLFASLQTYITPDAFTFDLSVLFFIAILIGGRGSILGPMLGTIILTILPEIAAPLGGMVDLPLRRAAAGDRAGDARRHRGAAGFSQPPSARQQPRHRSASCGAGRYRARERRSTGSSACAASR